MTDIWNLSSTYQFVVNNCPLQVDLTVIILLFAGRLSLYVNVVGGDSTSYK